MTDEKIIQKYKASVYDFTQKVYSLNADEIATMTETEEYKELIEISNKMVERGLRVNRVNISWEG